MRLAEGRQFEVSRVRLACGVGTRHYPFVQRLLERSPRALESLRLDELYRDCVFHPRLPTGIKQEGTDNGKAEMDNA